MTTNHFAATACVWLSLLAACDGNTDDLGSVEAGVYEIRTWSLNEGSCAVEGPSLLDVRVETHVVIAHVEREYEEFIAVEPCLDPQDCQFALEDVEAGRWPYSELNTGNQADGFAVDRGGVIATGDICRHWVEHATLVTEAGAARLERRTQYADLPRTGLFCDFTEEHQGGDAPCRELEVLTATRVSELP